MPLRTLCLLSLLAISSAAQPASDLLQSAIYQQETLGDLDGAIRIYRQILSAGAPMKVYAAQSQYRLGICLLRKGDHAAGVRALQSVVSDYPGEHELVARAREAMQSAGGLLPIPWGDSELSEYRWNIPGVTDGWSIAHVGPVSNQNTSLRIQMHFYSPQLNVTMVDVDALSMAPLAGRYRAPQYFRRAEPPESAAVQVYPSGALSYVLRRMPLANGWSAPFQMASPEGIVTPITAAVLSTEKVTVPAGTFTCFKVRLSGNSSPAQAPRWPREADGEILWYATTGSHALVKIQSGPSTGELVALRTAESKGTVSYRDPQVGYSFTLPARWVFHPRPSLNPPGTSVDLIDPDSLQWVVISAKSVKTNPDQIITELQKGAAQRLLERPMFTARSSVVYKQGDIDALSWIGENAGARRVQWFTWLQTESTRASIAVATDARDFEKFRRRFQPILDSFRMP